MSDPEERNDKRAGKEENLIGKEKLVQFDALSVYKKYTDVFDIDDVSEEERKEAENRDSQPLLAGDSPQKMESVFNNGRIS